MGKRYKNPPIIEALCEFRFEPSAPWDLTVPGLVYEKIRQEFPQKRQIKAVEIGTVAKPEGVEQQLLTTDRMQFLREDERALVQVGPDLLVINHLKPYSTWQKFLPLIQQGFDAYHEVAAPKNLRRIGLRYINRIEIATPSIGLEEYFEFRPFIGAKLPQDFGIFIVGIQFPYENLRDNLKLELASTIPATPETVTAILDLDYFLAQPEHMSLDNVFQWIEIAHSHIEEVFEASITDRLRDLFEEVTT